MTPHEQLKAIREAGIIQVDIAAALGVNQSLVSYALATPEYDPKSSLANKIQDLYKLVSEKPTYAGNEGPL